MPSETPIIDLLEEDVPNEAYYSPQLTIRQLDCNLFAVAHPNKTFYFAFRNGTFNGGLVAGQHVWLV